MAFNGQGERHSAIAPIDLVNAQIVAVDNIVGTAFKTAQPDRWVKPADYAQIPEGEGFEIIVGGLHRAPLTGAIAFVDVDDLIYIDPATQTLSTSGQAATAEVQTVSLTGTPTGGSFKLTFDGEVTAAIVYNATTTAVRQALEALANLAPGDVVVGGSAGAWTVTFAGSYGGQNVPQMTADGALLTGGTTPTATVATTTPGSSGRLPVGVVSEIDREGATDYALINSNAWQAFLPGA